ncbi:MAG: hypothetical protein K2H11_02260 [Malacoplasma sp.]|nr:hypothetical protein [Malacoplasma sp.]
MKVVEIDLDFKENFKCENLILGHFNLIHFGHYKLFSSLKNYSFLIFTNNPSKQKIPYSLEERIANIARFNPERIFVYNILKNNVDPSSFINNVLKKINPSTIIVGSDFCFGRNRTGKVDLLKKYFNVIEIKVYKKYSSSKIINLIESGNLKSANDLMLFNFYYQNKVIKGKGLATKLSIPTANIEDNKQIKIPSGSYASITLIDNIPYKSASFIGIPKSFEINKSFVETHIFNFNCDIYNKLIRVYPVEFIRENQKFNDINLLVKAIKSDIEKIKKVLKKINLDTFKF